MTFHVDRVDFEKPFTHMHAYTHTMTFSNLIKKLEIVRMVEPFDL